MPLQQEQKQEQTQKRQQKTINDEKINVATMGKFLSMEHGVQSVQSGRHAVTAVAFECHGKSQGGRRMFVATEQGEATVWPSAKVGHEGHDIYCSPQPTGKVTTCHFEGNKVATGYADGTCMVYNGNNGKKIMDTSPRHPVRDQRNPGKITTCKRFRVHFCISFYFVLLVLDMYALIILHDPLLLLAGSISEDGKTIMLGGGGYKSNDRCGWLFIRDISTGKKLFGFLGKK